MGKAKDIPFLIRECKRQGMTVIDNPRGGWEIRSNEGVCKLTLSDSYTVASAVLKEGVGYLEPKEFDARQREAERQRKKDELREKEQADLDAAQRRMDAEASKPLTHKVGDSMPQEPEDDEPYRVINNRIVPEWKCHHLGCRFKTTWPPSRGRHLSSTHGEKAEPLPSGNPPKPENGKKRRGSSVTIRTMSADQMTRRGAFNKVLANIREQVDFLETHMLKAIEDEVAAHDKTKELLKLAEDELEKSKKKIQRHLKGLQALASSGLIPDEEAEEVTV